MARDHLADPSLVDTPRSQDDVDEVNDIYLLGIEKFQSLLSTEALSNETSRFTWGFLEAELNDLSESLI